MDMSRPFAVIADIHGNALALAAVLADIEGLGIAQVINLGDVFSGPMDPAGVWDLLRGRDFLTVRGNHDRYLVDLAPEEMWRVDRFTRAALPPEALDWIGELPVELELDQVYACHATPRDDNLYWSEEVTYGAVHLAPRGMIEARAEGVNAGLILYGHTHLPRVLQLSGGRMMVNPGSVGCPGYSDELPESHIVQTGTPMASYAVVRRVTGGWQVEHRTVLYDWAAAAEQARRNGFENWARVVGTGWL
ncbi:metallophosphoesterase family protein [Pseudooceanicola sp.]|uniref:metallophosphoesterase family protein n=1 Tax=Pseudooceanicola sp. TaxID=1914328 RepID=UPI0035C6AD2A